MHLFLNKLEKMNMYKKLIDIIEISYRYINFFGLITIKSTPKTNIWRPLLFTKLIYFY